MSAPLLYPTIFDKQNLVGIFNRGKPVSDNDASPVLTQPVERFLNFYFRSGINAAGGLVQKQNRRICQNRPGNRQKLALALT